MRLVFADCAIDVARRELSRADVPVHVEPQVFDLLLHLIQNRDHVVGKDELVTAVWRKRAISDSTVNNRINAARQAIGDSGERQLFIRTVARRGFRFIGTVQEIRSDGLHRASGEAIVGHRPTGERPDKPSVAVLPFANLSGDPEQEFFADGITEDIITALSKARWLLVIARSSTFTYKGRTVDIKQVSRELGARYVLEGSVRKSGSRVRISAQLVEAVTSAHIWAERYDRDLVDIFGVQDEITKNVVTAIEPTMAQAEQYRVSRKHPDSLDAWEAYHRGLWHFLKHEPSENNHAKPFFQRAIDLDQSFAPGYYGLALTHLWDGSVHAERPLQDCLKAARPLAQRALALDDSDSMAHFVMACVFFFSGDSVGAREELDRAININPSNAWAVGVSGSLYGHNGQLKEALDEIGKAIQASPHDPMKWAWMLYAAHSNYFARNYEAALAAAEQVIRIRPDKSQGYRWKAAALGQLGRGDDAQIALNQAVAISSTNFDLHVRTRPPWFSLEEHSLLVEGLRKAGLGG